MPRSAGRAGGIWGTVFSVLGVNSGIKNSRRECSIGGAREAPPISRAPLVSRLQSAPGTAHSGSPRRVAKAGITDEPIGHNRALPFPSPFSPGPSPIALSKVSGVSLGERVCPLSVPKRETEAEVASPSPWPLSHFPWRRKTRIAECGYRTLPRGLYLFLSLPSRRRTTV